MPAQVELNRRPLRAGQCGNGTVGEQRIWSICILAGGLSSRMGRDKARVHLAGKTLVGHVREIAASTGWPVRVIRQDVVDRCGPLGGIITGLTQTYSAWVLFLACDMPLITCGLLEDVCKRAERDGRPVAVATASGAGFPMALPATARAKVEAVVAAKRFSLQALVAEMNAVRLRLPVRRRRELENLNTPADLDRLRRQWPSSVRSTPRSKL